MTSHLINGSPVNRSGHEQTGLWLTTTHLAWMPHVPGQGSLHFWLAQASFCRQSELRVHSGRQRGGDPRNSGAQLHTACPFSSRHMLFGPQGFGLHGLVTRGTMRWDNIVNIFSNTCVSVSWFFFFRRTSHYIARDKCISSGTGGTTAHGCMIYHVA